MAQGQTLVIASRRLQEAAPSSLARALDIQFSDVAAPHEMRRHKIMP
jgi:hypothetical protein